MQLLQALAVRWMTRSESGGAAAIVPPLLERCPLCRGWVTGSLVLVLLFILFPPPAAPAAGLSGPAAAGFTLLHWAAELTAGQFTARANLVEVYATVTDEAGRALTGLQSADFIIEEDGERQSIEAFATGDAPLALAVGVDRSFSVPPEVLSQVTAGVGTVVGRLLPGDRVMLLGIGSETEVIAPLDAGRDAVRAALPSLERWGTTPLFDAVIQAIDTIQPASGRRALILLSDGIDRYSRARVADVVRHAREHDVLVYPVSIGRTREAVWSEVATVSGARSFHVRDAREVAATLQAVVDELRHQYLLGYAPPNGGRAGWRSISVRVNRPRARVRARDGYLAPSR